MIDVALKFLRDYLIQEIPNPATVLGNITREDDISNNKIHLSLVHIEEEKVLKEVNHRRRINPGDDFFTVINPEIRLNLYVLVTYQYTGKNYDEALKQLGNVATVFQGKYFFTKPDFIKPAYEPLQQIVLELYTQSLDQNSNMWQAMGEKLSPALIYKVRVVAIQASKALANTGEVRAIGVNTIHKPVEL